MTLNRIQENIDKDKTVTQNFTRTILSVFYAALNFLSSIYSLSTNSSTPYKLSKISLHASRLQNNLNAYSDD